MQFFGGFISKLCNKQPTNAKGTGIFWHKCFMNYKCLKENKKVYLFFFWVLFHSIFLLYRPTLSLKQLQDSMSAKERFTYPTTMMFLTFPKQVTDDYFFPEGHHFIA